MFPSVVIGRLLIALGVAGGLLLLAVQFDGLPVRLLHFLRSNAAAWLLASSVLGVVGVRLLWQAGHRRTSWQPTHPGMRFHTVVVYSRPECLLCEDAVETLNQYRNWLPAPLEVNIADDAELLTTYREAIPVVEIDGKLRFQGSVNEVLLRRLIEGTPPLPQLRMR